LEAIIDQQYPNSIAAMTAQLEGHHEDDSKLLTPSVEERNESNADDLDASPIHSVNGGRVGTSRLPTPVNPEVSQIGMKELVSVKPMPSVAIDVSALHTLAHVSSDPQHLLSSVSPNASTSNLDPSTSLNSSASSASPECVAETDGGLVTDSEGSFYMFFGSTSALGVFII
jgi:hypothetical protein